MEKITQKEFKNILINKSNTLIQSLFINTNDKEKILQIFEKLEDKQTTDLNFRVCSKAQTNALQFSNNSWIYFDNEALEKSYYKNNNFIMGIESYDNEKSSVIVYLTK